METEIRKAIVLDPTATDLDKRNSGELSKENNQEKLSLGEKEEISESAIIEKEGMYFSPKEGLNFLTFLTPWKKYQKHGFYKGGNAVTYYCLYDGILYSCDDRWIGAPQKLIIQLPMKTAQPEYVSSLNFVKLPKNAEEAHAVVYLSGKRTYAFKIVQKNEFEELIVLHKTHQNKELRKRLPFLKLLNKLKKK
jgi:hypothetical protein